MGGKRFIVIECVISSENKSLSIFNVGNLPNHLKFCVFSICVFSIYFYFFAAFGCVTGFFSQQAVSELYCVDREKINKDGCDED